MVLLAFVLSIALVLLLLPMFNEVGAKKMEIPWGSSFLWISVFIFILLTGLLAGSYPALYLSSFQPLKVLKGTFRVGKMASVPRKILVVSQFTISVALIIGTVIVYQQMRHAVNRPIGYTRAGLVSMGLEKEIKGHFDAFKNELVSAGAIVDMAASNSPMTEVWNSNGGFDWEGKDPSLAVDFPNNRISYDFGKTVQWKIKEGRDFSREFGTDTSAFLINEAMVKFLGFKEPVGKILRWNKHPFTIIGVVTDIMQESPYYPVRPTLYTLTRKMEYEYNLTLRLNPNQNAKQSITTIERTWKKYVADVPFAYKFVDDQFGNKFDNEERIGKLLLYFAVLAIFISCLGLFGMASFVAEQRTKEIGIRKVLGATVPNLWGLLSKEFVMLVLISCLIATPIAWYYLNSWLKDYDYRVKIQWQVFVATAVVALVITLVTVSFQAIKAAIANPTKSLRTE